jgi:hypothetical protein
MSVKSVRLFTTSLGNQFMIEIAHIFAEGFRGNGIDTELLIDKLPNWSTDALQIIVAPHEFYPLWLEKSLNEAEIIDLTRLVYFLTMEQPGNSWFELSCRYARHARGIFDINYQGFREFRGRGFPVIHTPLGYDICFETISDSAVHSDIDLLFMGSNSPKRELFLSQNASLLNQYNSHLVISRVEKPRLISTPGFYSGLERNRLLAQSKILLNIHYGECAYLEWHRVLLAIANRCLVISETSEHIEPLIEGQHLIIATLEDIPSKCKYYLEHEDERLKIVSQAYEFVTKQLNASVLSKSLLEILESKQKPI